MERGPVREPVIVLLLMIVTCGLYFFYYYFVSCDEINRGLGYKKLNVGLDFVLGILTCGLWFIWWHWQAAEAVVELEQNWGVQPKMDAPIIFLCSLFGLGEMMMQIGMNNAWQNGMPGGAQRHLESDYGVNPVQEQQSKWEVPSSEPPPGTDGW